MTLCVRCLVEKELAVDVSGIFRGDSLCQDHLKKRCAQLRRTEADMKRLQEVRAGR